MYAVAIEGERQEELRNATAAKMLSRNKTPKKKRNHFNINFSKARDYVEYSSNNKMCAFSQPVSLLIRFARLEIAISRLVQHLELLRLLFALQ